MTWLTPDTAVSVLIYVCAVGIPLALATGLYSAIRVYAPAPLGELLRAKPRDRDLWELQLRWGRVTHRVEGRGTDWIHCRSRKPVRSRGMRAWLGWQWETLEPLRARLPERDPLLDQLEADESGIVVKMSDTREAG
jgi:hypothetical protein